MMSKLYKAERTSGFWLLCLVAAFMLLLTFFTVNNLAPVSESRLIDCETRITSYEQKLEVATSEGASEKYINELKYELNKYNARHSMLLDREKYYALSMIILLLFYLLSVVCLNKSGIHFSATLSAIVLLLAIGITFRATIYYDLSDVFYLCLALIAGTVVFLVSRKLVRVKFPVFLVIIGAIALLLAVNIIFGKNTNGARLWVNIGPISFQPGEVVKFLLVILAAFSYTSRKTNKKRVVLYYLTLIVSCLVLLLLRDLGNAIVVFSLGLFMTVWLLNDKKLFLIGLVFAISVLIVVPIVVPYVSARFDMCGKALLPGGNEQQAQMLKAFIMGGFGGLGIENSTYLVNIFSIDSDMVIAGIYALFGIGMLLIVMLCYAIIILTPLKNVSMYPWNYFVTSQVALLIGEQALINFLGSVDIIPFTGIVAPLLSDGGSALIVFSAMLGLMLAALNPQIKPLEEDNI